MENLKINCSARKTLTRAGASRAGKRSLVKSPRIFYTRTANEHLAMVFDPRNDCATRIIATPSLLFSPVHSPSRRLSSNHKQTHSCRTETGYITELCQVCGQECDHTAALSCCSQLMVKSKILFFHCQTQIQ